MDGLCSISLVIDEISIVKCFLFDLNNIRSSLVMASYEQKNYLEKIVCWLESIIFRI